MILLRRKLKNRDETKQSAEKKTINEIFVFQTRLISELLMLPTKPGPYFILIEVTHGLGQQL